MPTTLLSAPVPIPPTPARGRSSFPPSPPGLGAAVQAVEDVKAALERGKQTKGAGAVGEVLKAAKGPLKAAGVCGRLGDLGAVDAAYDVAASTAADMLDYVVVETAAGGQKCIEFLREKKLGRANFVVLDQVKAPKPAGATPDGAPRLFDLVTPSHPKYAGAFYMALRDTLGGVVRNSFGNSVAAAGSAP